jgi:hypothetical protein
MGQFWRFEQDGLKGKDWVGGMMRQGPAPRIRELSQLLIKGYCDGIRLKADLLT